MKLLIAVTALQITQDAGPHNLPVQRLGIHDLIAVSVYRSPELTRTVRVDADGSIALPLLQAPIAAAGIFPSGLETAITAALKAEGILVNPVVKVTVVEYSSRPVSVAGAVRKPVTFQAAGRVTLVDALNHAEGLTQEAGGDILVTRPGAREPLRIPVKGLIDGADPALNIQLHGGEEIRVPEGGRIYVVGNVRKPGAFPVREAGQATVLKLIAMAEGLAPYAYKQAFITRTDPASGAKREISVELEKIMARKAPDVPLDPNDILYVPDNKGKRNAMMLVDRLTSFGASTASGVLIWRR